MATTLKLKTNDFRRALNIVKPAIQRPVTIPVLAAVKVEADHKGQLSMLTTNLDLSVRVRTQDAYEGSPLCIVGERLMTWIKLQDAEEAKMTESANGRVTLTCGRGKAVIPTLAASSFPNVDVPKAQSSVTLQQRSLLAALKMVAFAISEESSRYTLQGALLDVRQDEIRLVATDGHRLSLYKIACDVAHVGSILLPQAYCRLLLGSLDDSESPVTVGWDDNAIVATFDRLGLGSVEVISRRMSEGLRFPNYEAVVPRDEGKGFTLLAADLLRAFRRTGTFADSTSGQVRLTFQADGILTHSADAQAGECDDFVSAATGIEEPITTGLAGRYVTEALAQMTGDVRITVKSWSEAVVFRSEPAAGSALTYVVMPMRV